MLQGYDVKMPYMQISLNNKQRITDSFERNDDYLQVTGILCVSRAAANGIVRQFQASDEVARSRDGSCEKVAKMAHSLVEIVQDFSAYTLVQINTELRQLPDKLHVSCTTVVNALDRQLMLKDAPIERNSPRTEAARRNYVNWMMNDGVNQQLIFIHESGFNLFTR